jgi:hypothetical protein
LIPFAFFVWVFEFLTIVDPSKKNYDINPLRVFTEDYWSTRWPAISSYLSDNFTMWFTIIALIGLILIFTKLKTKFGKFMFGYAVSFIPYLFLISSKFAGHAYYQFPYLPMVCMLSAFAFFFVGDWLKKFSPYLKYAPLILILFALPAMNAANDRVFSTIMPGQDILGAYLGEQMIPGERFAAFTDSQDLATCSYAKHRCGFVSNLSEFKHKEEIFDLRYVYVGSSKLQSLFESQDDLWKYIRANYGIDTVGLIEYENQLAPIHFILKKGSSFNMSGIEKLQPYLVETYKTKLTNINYYIIQP